MLPDTAMRCAECKQRVTYENGAWICPTHRDRKTVEPVPPKPAGREPGVPWQVQSPPQNHPDYGRTYFVQRPLPNGDKERAAICFDYGVACVIEAVMNLRDGTVE